MRPGEVQRWRLLAATAAVPLVVALRSSDSACPVPSLNVVSLDGLTIPRMVTLPPGRPVVLGAGNRADVLVQAATPCTYELQALDPTAMPGWAVSLSGMTGAPGTEPPQPRNARIGFDFQGNFGDSGGTPTSGGQILSYPIALARVVVGGEPVEMRLPSGNLPVPPALPAVPALADGPVDAARNVAFEICGTHGAPSSGGAMGTTADRLPSCEFYLDRYDAEYWGGIPFENLFMMRDADDQGVPAAHEHGHGSGTHAGASRTGYAKEGLFDHHTPLFDDMFVGNREEWTVWNRTNSDHPFHIHQNPFLVTHINGVRLVDGDGNPAPEWHDTITVPAASPQRAGRPLIGNECPRDSVSGQYIQNPDCDPANATNKCCTMYGSVTFRTELEPISAGRFVMHCHILSHEDLGMMQLLEVKSGPVN